REGCREAVSRQVDRERAAPERRELRLQRREGERAREGTVDEDDRRLHGPPRYPPPCSDATPEATTRRPRSPAVARLALPRERRRPGWARGARAARLEPAARRRPRLGHLAHRPRG